ncbi:hypothetical protein GWI33_022369 [Rhynchophorus ferrugineus]|uniref:Uncharacterized protein n=1 Tax=Rhynchophorus ferrugineus TaxID=354439 RepID=A0A834J0F0_RHYFE|nr:hypothetical protein GWI33_022369 [Rhynchophorus ferrugineus]
MRYFVVGSGRLFDFGSSSTNESVINESDKPTNENASLPTRPPPEILPLNVESVTNPSSDGPSGRFQGHRRLFDFGSSSTNESVNNESEKRTSENASLPTRPPPEILPLNGESVTNPSSDGPSGRFQWHRHRGNNKKEK